jgi:hypothetical protein
VSTALLDLTSDVRAACGTRLATVAGLPPRAQWALQGVPFTPTANVAWLRESLHPIDTSPRTVGPRRRVEAIYLYRVALFVPTGAATQPLTKTLDAFEGAVFAAFETGVTFAAPTGRPVRVRDLRAGADVVEADWTSRAVLVTCTADAITAS